MKETLKQIIDNLKELHKNQRELRKLGVDLYEITEKYYDTVILLLKLTLTKEGIEDIEYYIHEFQEDWNWTYTPEPYGTKVVQIKTYDDFYQYLIDTKKFI